MLDRLRELYYTGRYGEEDGMLMLRIEQTVRRIPMTERYQPWMLKRFDWLRSLPLADCLEGVELLAAQHEMRRGQEGAVLLITKKNRLQMQVDSLTKMIRAEGDSTVRDELEAHLEAARQELGKLEAAVAQIKADARAAEAPLQARRAAFYARCGNPENADTAARDPARES